MRVLIWSQHLLGTGHLQRSARLADALAARGHDVILVNGGPAPRTVAQHYRRVDLPAIRALDERFDRLIGSDGRPVDDALWAARAAALDAATATKTDAMLVEMFPFGRRAFARELEPLLARLRRHAPRPRLLVSLRDVLVEKPKPGRAGKAAERVERWFDRVLVHADPRLIRLDTTFAPARRLAGYVRYTGYVAPTLVAPATDADRSGVLVSAGGGSVGLGLLRAAAGAARLCGNALGRWTLIGGHALPAADWAALQTDAGGAVTLLRHVDDLPDRLGRASVSVSQAGYNTVVEAMTQRCPMVLVPFATGAETEQTRRARAVASVGAASVVAEADLEASSLAAAVRDRVDRPFPPLSLDIDGARRSAMLIEAVVAGRA